MPNRLVHTSSPYLLQHAQQPVDWHPWGEEALNKAQQAAQPILVSIGYAACHWCHVMAQEAFEDQAVAALMNAHFVCIKVDREERPDIDQVYAAAAQAMGLQVGWPLHVFLLPDQKPFYGGLYFPIEAWKKVLVQVTKAFRHHRGQLEAAALQFTQALNEQVAARYRRGPASKVMTQEAIQEQFLKLYQGLDHQQGGIRGTPKFPMPSIGLFLLHYYCLTQDAKALAQLQLTLQRMAYGGIYDQLGGGFARYATDEAWRIPHFEKMLYDNGQLLSLYAQAYTVTKQPLYKKVVRESIAFVERELASAVGGFYSALDADSEGAEGKFYTWTKAEVEAVLGKEAPFFMEHFNMTATGNWEQGGNILYQKADSALTATAQARIEQARQTLFTVRTRRKHPALDKKLITSWNGIMLQGLVDAYDALGEEHLLARALKTAGFIEQYLLQGNRLWHSYSKGHLGAPGYLEDYAWVAQAFMSLYQATFAEHWLYTAETLVQYTMDHFYDAQGGLFYFVEKGEAKLIARPKEIWDHVVPSANSVLAHSLFRLGILLDQAKYTATATQLLSHVAEHLNRTPLYLSNWAILYMRQLQPSAVVAIVGPQCKAWTQAMKQRAPRGSVFVGTVGKSNLPWLANKKALAGKTTIYVCRQGTCQAPTQRVEEALAQLASIS